MLTRDLHTYIDKCFLQERILDERFKQHNKSIYFQSQKGVLRLKKRTRCVRKLQNKQQYRILPVALPTRNCKQSVRVSFQERRKNPERIVYCQRKVGNVFQGMDILISRRLVRQIPSNNLIEMFPIKRCACAALRRNICI